MKTKLNKVYRNTRSFLLLLLTIALVISVIMLVVRFISKDVAIILMPVILVLNIGLMGGLFYLLKKFFHSIDKIDENAIKLSQGKLNGNDIIAEELKGLEVLAATFNDVKRNLISYIESTKSNVIILSSAVDKVTKSIDMSYKGNEQIAVNMSTVSEKATELLNIAKDTLDGIEAVSQGAAKITSTLGNLDHFVENTVKITTEGAGHLEKYNEQVHVISTNLEDTTSFIDNLKLHINHINEFGTLIISITEQLRLLSLNSQIEAARAGDAGLGFRVVAQEMNKLSDQTKESATQITKLLADIMKSNSKVSDSLNNVTTSFDISKKIFESLKVSFDRINSNANILSSDVKTVYEESRMISENTVGINKQSSVVHDMANEISSITEDVAAVTQEELAENEEINTQAVSLKKMLSSIENLLKRYETSILPVNQNSTRPIKLIMVIPNDQGFWEAVRQGALYAITELKGKNVNLSFVDYDKANTSFAQLLKDEIDTSCDGLIVPGFIKGIEQCVNMANQKNIPVMAYNCDLENGIKRLSYFGPDISYTGKLAGDIMARGIEEEGRLIIFRGDTKSSIHTIRRDSLMKALSRYKEIHIASEVDDLTSSTQVNKKLKEILYYQPDIKGIIFIGGGAAGAVRALEEMKLTEKVKIFCFDYDDEILDLMKKGFVFKAMGQDPFGQGHDPIIYLYNYLVAGAVPENVTYTRTEVLDARSLSEE
jgi:methyl-accepting chemotaxis protein/ABC-type sugar transport system substrate-binding protein